MAPTLGAQNAFASKLGLDTHETNPVLLRKMHRWKQSKHKQRIMEARQGAKTKAAGPRKVGVPFSRSGFAKDKLPPVDSRAHREMLDDSMGDLSATLEELQGGAGRTTPEQAMQDYYEANAPGEHVPRQPQRRRHKQSRHPRQRRRPDPAPLSARPDFDCTPLDNRGDVSQSGLKIRREVATREPPRKQKQSRALEGIIEQRSDRSDSDSDTPPSTENSASTSPETRSADSDDLTKAQRTIAQLRKLLHEEKEKTTLRVQEAQTAARQKTDQLNAALAQTKTQLRMLQKQLHKAREEATAAQEAAESTSATSEKRDASTAPDISEIAGNTSRGFARIRLRPRSEQRARDASTPPSRIPEPRSLRTPSVRPPVIQQAHAPPAPPQDTSSCVGYQDTPTDAANDCPATPHTVEALVHQSSPPDVRTEMPNDDHSAHTEAMMTSDAAVENAPAGEAEGETADEEETVRLERGLSTSTSCSFCVTGSPPIASDTSGMEPPEAELEPEDEPLVDSVGLNPQDEGEDRNERGCELSEVQGTGPGTTDVVKLTDRAIDGVARALDAIDSTSESIRSEARIANAGGSAAPSADEWWHGCGPPAIDTSADAEGDGREEAEGAEGSDEEELPVEIVTR